jgi:phosphoglycolate phosphatase-like HAD superfamily hydrolase
MLLLSEYDVFIFDCDGVILDANKLKIEAMQYAIESAGFSTPQSLACCDYFAKNFGRSRFHHVQYFVDVILNVSVTDKDATYTLILEAYSAQCKTLYLNANMTSGFLAFIAKHGQEKYVASGSAQEELRWVFTQRALSVHFSDVLGSPTQKPDLLADIIARHPVTTRFLMIGDAVSDFEASQKNQIDFLAYLKHSTVLDKMQALSKTYSFKTIMDWSEIC